MCGIQKAKCAIQKAWTESQPTPLLVQLSS
jgi:hypothetical protein